VSKQVISTLTSLTRIPLVLLWEAAVRSILSIGHTHKVYTRRSERSAKPRDRISSVMLALCHSSKLIVKGQRIEDC